MWSHGTHPQSWQLGKKIGRVGRGLEFAFHPQPVAVAKIGERRRLDEHQAFHRLCRLIGDEEMVRLDAQVGVRVARVRLTDDDAFDDHQLLLVVRGARGERGLVKVWLREIVSKCAQHRRKHEDKHPARPGRAPGKDDAHSGDECRNAEREGGQRKARREPEAEEPYECDRDEGHCHVTILSHFHYDENTR